MYLPYFKIEILATRKLTICKVLNNWDLTFKLLKATYVDKFVVFFPLKEKAHYTIIVLV